MKKGNLIPATLIGLSLMSCEKAKEEVKPEPSMDIGQSITGAGEAIEGMTNGLIEYVGKINEEMEERQRNLISNVRTNGNKTIGERNTAKAVKSAYPDDGSQICLEDDELKKVAQQEAKYEADSAYVCVSLEEATVDEEEVIKLVIRDARGKIVEIDQLR